MEFSHTHTIHSTKHWLCWSAMWSTVLCWNSTHRWKDGHIRWNCQSNCHRRRSNRHWSHSKMCQTLIMATKLLSQRVKQPKPCHHNKNRSKTIKHRTMSNVYLSHTPFEIVSRCCNCVFPIRIHLCLHRECDHFKIPIYV